MRQLSALIENKVGREPVPPLGGAHMQNWGVLILVVMVFVANLPAVMQQWRADRPGFIKTLWLMGAYALYIALGIGLLLLLAPVAGEGEPKVLLLTGAGTLVVGGLLLFSVVLLRRRERAAQAWMLGSAGADRRDLLGVLGWEYGLVTGAGVVVGLLAGTTVAAVTLVSMTLGPDGQLLVPAPQLVLPWPLLLGAPALMAVAPLLGLLWLTRRDHGRALTADAPVGGHR